MKGKVIPVLEALCSPDPDVRGLGYAFVADKFMRNIMADWPPFLDPEEVRVAIVVFDESALGSMADARPEHVPQLITTLRRYATELEQGGFGDIGDQDVS